MNGALFDRVYAVVEWAEMGAEKCNTRLERYIELI